MADTVNEALRETARLVATDHMQSRGAVLRADPWIAGGTGTDGKAIELAAPPLTHLETKALIVGLGTLSELTEQSADYLTRMVAKDEFFRAAIFKVRNAAREERKSRDDIVMFGSAMSADDLVGLLCRRGAASKARVNVEPKKLGRRLEVALVSSRILDLYGRMRVDGSARIQEQRLNSSEIHWSLFSKYNKLAHESESSFYQMCCINHGFWVDVDQAFKQFERYFEERLGKGDVVGASILLAHATMLMSRLGLGDTRPSMNMLSGRLDYILGRWESAERTFRKFASSSNAEVYRREMALESFYMLQLIYLKLGEPARSLSAARSIESILANPLHFAQGKREGSRFHEPMYAWKRSYFELIAGLMMRETGEVNSSKELLIHADHLARDAASRSWILLTAKVLRKKAKLLRLDGAMQSAICVAESSLLELERGGALDVVRKVRKSRSDSPRRLRGKALDYTDELRKHLVGGKVEAEFKLEFSVREYLEELCELALEIATIEAGLPGSKNDHDWLMLARTGFLVLEDQRGVEKTQVEIRRRLLSR